MNPLPATTVAQTSKSVHKQHTAAYPDELGKEIHEVIKDLPPSLVESEITWPEDVSGLKALIERDLDGPLRALPNELLDAARMRVTQNPPGGQNISQTYPGQSNLVPSHTIGPGNVAINGDGPRAVAPGTQQPQVPPRAHQSSQPVSRVNAGAPPDARPWDLNMGGPVPQFHQYPVGYPATPRYSAPSQYQLPPNGTQIGSYHRLKAVQEMQARENGQNFQDLQASHPPQGSFRPRLNGQAPQSHQLQQSRGPGLSNHAQHNGGLQQSVGYNQSGSFQQTNGSQQSVGYNQGTSLQSGGFQQNGYPQQNNRFQQSNEFQQNNGFHQSNGFQQYNGFQQNNAFHQSQASRQGKGSQSEIISDNVPNNSHEDNTSHQENSVLKRRRSTADPDGDGLPQKVSRKE